MKIRYLFDENLDPRFAVVLERHYPMIDVLYERRRLFAPSFR